MAGDRGSGLINRGRELTQLRELADRGIPALALVYGRRRVGKTYLLDHAWPERRVFYFLAANTTADLNRAELLRDLARQTGREIDPHDYPTWRTVFRLLVELAGEAPLVVVLDEFQYLLNQADDIASQLVAVWDRELRDRPLLLVLCGSEVATMEGLAGGSQPLFGRFALAIKLQPLDYYDARGFLPARPLREAALLYGAMSGRPRYLAAVRPEESLAESLSRLLLSPSGEVHLQVERVIEQEPGIRDPAEYGAVLTAVAAGGTQVNEIAMRAGVEARAVRRILEVLERLDLIRRERNFGAPPKAPWRHRIADNAVRFWYRFVHANRSRLATGAVEEVWTQQVAPFLDDSMGTSFEAICRDAYRRQHAQWGLPGAADWARWEGHDRNRRPIELDIVARLDDGRLLTGEIKWSTRPVGIEIHFDLLRDIDDLARSGQGWAHQAQDRERSVGRLYISAAGFTEEFKRLAAADGRIRLVTLEDLYAPS